MDTRTGEMHRGMLSEEFDKLQEKNRFIKEITEQEFNEFSNIPKEQRPAEWACSQYIKSLERKPGDMELFRLKAAFRAGFEAGVKTHE